MSGLAYLNAKETNNCSVGDSCVCSCVCVCVCRVRYSKQETFVNVHNCEECCMNDRCYECNYYYRFFSNHIYSKKSINEIKVQAF